MVAFIEVYGVAGDLPSLCKLRHTEATFALLALAGVAIVAV